MTSIDKTKDGVEAWSTDLGLLPIPLFPVDDNLRYVLANGTTGNFCLDLSDEGRDERDEKRAGAWSSNVGHYVSVFHEDVEVLRYDSAGSVAEKYTLRSVQSNLRKFHAYLESSQPRSEMSVIAHAIRVFRQLREVSKHESGPESLLAFLALIACASDECSRQNINLSKWGLPSARQSYIDNIHEVDWGMLSNELIRGRYLESLILRPELLLRHAAGQVFQEAHYEASLMPQLRLVGFPPPPSKAPNKSTRGIGVHFTPPFIARMVVEQSIRSIDVKTCQSLVVFDPACGSGEFLRESIRQLRMKGFKGSLKLIGWDISPAACDMARFVLSWERSKDQYSTAFDVQHTDSAVAPNWPQDIDILFMNPPFVSYEFLSQGQREEMREALGPMAKGRYDLSTLFVWRAVRSLRSGSVFGTIIPSSFLEAAAAGGIRKAVAERVGLKLIARLGSPLLFSDALVDAAVIVGQVGAKQSHDGIAFWADYRTSSTFAGLRELRRVTALDFKSPVVVDGFSIYRQTLGEDRQSWSPRSFEARRLVSALRHLPKVHDLFDIKQGSRSGHLKTFLISKDEWLAMDSRIQPYFRPAVVNGSVVFGSLRDQKYIFYPYGKQQLKDEEELELKLGQYFSQTLKPAEAILRKRSSKRDGDRWWEMSEPRTWQFARVPKIVTVYFGGSGSFAYDSSGSYVVVQGYCWRPLSRVTRSKLFIPMVARAYITLLNSDLMSQLLPAFSNQVQGGQWDLSSRFVESIPIPDLFSQVNSQLLSNLAKFGIAIERGDEFDSEACAQAVLAAYGISDK